MMACVRLLILFVTIGALGAACGGGKATGGVDGYVALVPRVLRAGESESVSLTLFKGQQLADGMVRVKLSQKDAPTLEGAARIDGKGTVQIDIPAGATGEYGVTVEGPGFKDSTQVQVQSGALLFLETDKPIYKPGQTVMMRVVALNSELKPLAAAVAVEVTDAKGVKVFKQDVQTGEFGMATLELPLSAEPNLGVWKVRTQAGDTFTDTDVRVEEYVLPKYEVSVEMAKTWFLVNEQIAGHVAARYSFGKPVNGELTVKATRYVGAWEEFATFTAPVTDGAADFTVQQAGYVAGVPEAGGLGNVQLDVTVTERNTGYVEKTTELVTVAAAPVALKLIPESPVFKPGLPFNVLLISETPDGQPVESQVSFSANYMDEKYQSSGEEQRTVETKRGSALATLDPPDGAVNLNLSAHTGDAWTSTAVSGGYSPSGNFIHVEQREPLDLKAGDTASFHVDSTSEARTFYYEIVARDRVVFTGAIDSPDIEFTVTPAMSPSARLLVYQVLPDSEVAADFIPFESAGEYPQKVAAGFSVDEAKPGDGLQVEVQTEGPAKVGLVAVDRSVFILAENRLNLQQVFAEIERLYQQPQAELHDFEPLPLLIPGAQETFENAGLTVLSDKRVPEGQEIEAPFRAMAGMGGDLELAPGVQQRDAAGAFLHAAPTGVSSGAGTAALAEVQRVRQFFPETWIWEEVLTDSAGRATLPVQAPDSITTWDLRAVAVSPEKGLGIAEASVRVFQPFFLQADLPYSAIRGEELPLKVSLYNYLDSEQTFQVEIEPQPWFDLLEDAAKSVTVGPNDTGGVEFKIRPTGVGMQTAKVTARSAGAADAVIKSMIVEPEGVQREQVENGVVNDGASRTIALPTPADAVPDSARAYVAVTGSFLAQTIEGLDGLLQMPYGCGEQNMILFAPDVYILKYLKETDQARPEIQAKAQTLLITGYQRELTYRRGDGSFSAFGESDPEGSLFLTAFVLKTFAQAKGLVFVDDAVLSEAANWISGHQNADGSFDAVGFLAHEDLMGGVSGKDALTAYVTVALIEAGQKDAAAKAVDYLDGRLGAAGDPYSLALMAYALELAGSDKASMAYDALMAAAEQDDDGLHWSAGPAPQPLRERGFNPYGGSTAPSSGIEATGYGLLALTLHGDQVNAAAAAKWLVAHRNSAGGFGSTQDTVVALQALTEFSSLASADVDLALTVRAGDATKEVRINSQNFDVTQVVEVPAGVPVEIAAVGKGQAVYQAVSRYNLPAAEAELNVFDITVDFDTADVSVNDMVGVDVSVTFNPPEPVKAGMVVLDVAVPTGFAPVTETLDALAAQNQKVKRYDVAGRKVIVYIEDMVGGEKLSFSFDVQALYPVRARGAASQAYSYYNPQWRGETVGEAVSIGEWGN